MAIRIVRVGKVDVATSSGTFFHDELFHRDYENQHPISAITGLLPKINLLEQMIKDKENIFRCDSPDLLPNADNVQDHIALVMDGEDYYFYTFDSVMRCWVKINEQKKFNISDYISDVTNNLIDIDKEGKIFVRPIIKNSHSTQLIFKDVSTMDVLKISKEHDTWFSSIGIYKIWKKITLDSGVIFQAVSPLNYVEQQTMNEIQIIWKDEDTEEIRINFETNESIQSAYVPKLITKEWNSMVNSTLDMIADIRQIFDNSGWESIWISELTIENLADTTEPPLILKINDNTINVLTTEIRGKTTQKYNLGISINNEIFVKGKFNAKLYIQGL